MRFHFSAPGFTFLHPVSNSRCRVQFAPKRACKPLLLRVGRQLDPKRSNATRGLCGPNTAVLKPTVTLSHHLHRLLQILGGNFMMQSPYDIHRPATLMACKQLILSNFPHALRRMPEDACRQGKPLEPWCQRPGGRSYGTPT